MKDDKQSREGGKRDDASAEKNLMADVIRRARDARNAAIEGTHSDAADSASDEDVGGAAEEGGAAPNYVDMIDRKMREQGDK